MGVLTSKIHLAWALRMGSRLEDRPTYNNSLCFEPFPFPELSVPLRLRIRTLAERLDTHRRRQQALHPSLTITGMYNVLDKLRASVMLDPKEKIVHEQALTSTLCQIHDDLDAAVFDAYGWPHDLTDEQILERLVALNAERAAEEKRGLIRWLRPEFQNPKGKAQVATQQEIGMGAPDTAAAVIASELTWPDGSPAQLAALRSFLYSVAGMWTAKQIAKRFMGGKKKDVEAALASLEALGIVVSHGDGEERAWTALRPSAPQRRTAPLTD